MDDEIERLVVSVRADTNAFASDVAAMKAQLDGPFADGIGKVGQALETTLSRAIRNGKLGFDDLKRVAVAVLSEITSSALSIKSGSGSSGLLSGLVGAVGSLFGLPGRATGGPVAGGNAYMVGERGPELFVPTSSGRIETLGGAAQKAVNITVNVTAPGDGSRMEMTRTGQQLARAVRRALEKTDG